MQQQCGSHPHQQPIGHFCFGQCKWDEVFVESFNLHGSGEKIFNVARGGGFDAVVDRVLYGSSITLLYG